MPLGPESPLSAMLTGFASGDRQAASILPNQFQPMGKPAAKNPFQGSIDLIIKQLLDITYEVQQQGDEHRDCVEKLYKIVFDLSKVNNELTDIAEGDESSGGY